MKLLIKLWFKLTYPIENRLASMVGWSEWYYRIHDFNNRLLRRYFPN